MLAPNCNRKMPSRTLAGSRQPELPVTIRLAERVKRIKPSPTLALTGARRAPKAEGKDIIGLGAGEPDFDTPVHIAGRRRRRDPRRPYPLHGGRGHGRAQGRDHRQVPPRQRPRVRALADPRLERREADHLQPVLAVLDAGDEAVIPAPYWVSYPDMVLLADGMPVPPLPASTQGSRSRPPSSRRRSRRAPGSSS